jgi:hypothetical protein
MFYVEFPVDYTTVYNLTADDYSPSGGDVEFCLNNMTEMFEVEREVFVTDLLKGHTWPASPGPLQPVTTNDTLYGDPNGFRTKFYQNGSNVNQWCLKSSHFGKFFEAFKG